MPLNNFTAGNGSFIELQSTESTNNYAMGLIKQGLAQHGSACFAHCQTNGKGQRGKQWLSNPGENIALSVIVDITEVLPLNQFVFNTAIAVSCYNFYKKYAIDEVAIKWPNDLYWRDRKAAGILIENNYKGSLWQWAVIGVGININQTTFNVAGKKPVSLKQITGKSFDCVTLAKELQLEIMEGISSIKYNNTNIVHTYNNVLFKKDEQQVFKKNNEQFTAIVQGVNIDGQLQLNYNGQLLTLNHGDAEWII